LNYHVLPRAVNLTNYQGSTPNIKLFSFPFMGATPIKHQDKLHLIYQPDR
jgi:hypothetical protein